MKARLTHIEAKRRREGMSLGADEIRVGRDPDSDLVVEGVRASRLHALIRPLGDRHTVTDTGSTNGTTVNGVALARTPVLLESGDLIEFAGEFAYLYETGPTVSTQRWLIAACVMVVFLVVSSGVAYWRLVMHQPILAEAIELAREGREAGERGDLPVASLRLSEAARLLIRNGYLDHVDRSDLMPAAMAQLEAELGDDSNLSELLGRVQEAQQLRVEEVIAGDAEQEAPAGTLPTADEEPTPAALQAEAPSGPGADALPEPDS